MKTLMFKVVVIAALDLLCAFYAQIHASKPPEQSENSESILREQSDTVLKDETKGIKFL